MSEWRKAALAAFFEIDNSKLGPHDTEPTVLSLSKYEGFVRADDYFDKRIASANLDGYKTVPVGGWAFSTIHIDEGSIALNSLEAGVISPMYTTIRWIGDGIALPSFIAHVVRQPFMLDEYKRRAQGTVNRRRSLPFKAFSQIEISLPTIDEQRRIVAVLLAVDEQIAALNVEKAATQHLLRRYLTNELDKLEGRDIAISEACERVIGGIWGSPEGVSEVDVLALGPRVYGFGTTALLTAGSPTRSFTRKQVEDRLVKEGDIILERSGGSPEQPVCRVVIAGSAVEPCVPTDFQRLLRPDTARIEPRFLFWSLQADWNEGVSVNYSRRTTGITNLSVKDYISRAITIPSREEQVRLVTGADAIEVVSRRLSFEIEALRTVRADLLSVLLSQEITVDAAVDKFVTAA